MDGIDLLEPLAAGGRAPRRAQVRGTGRVVVVRSAAWHEEERSAALGREADLLRAHPLPGLVELVDVVEDEHGRSLVLAHVGGGSLADRLTGRGPLPVEDALDLGARLAATLAELHERGIVHGAVEPRHVLLDAELRPLLCDLTSARTSREASDRTEDLRALGDVVVHAAGGIPDQHVGPTALPGLLSAPVGPLLAGEVADAETARRLLDASSSPSTIARSVGSPPPTPPVDGSQSGGGGVPRRGGQRLGVGDDVTSRALAVAVVVVSLLVPAAAVLFG